MLRPRVIPCLLIKNGGLVKTVKFGAPKYVGDPINAVKIFNEKEVDELIVVDIDATAAGAEPNYERIRNLAAECRMPLCYGGGITTAAQAGRIIGMGVEKVAISAAAVATPQLIDELATTIGAQSVVVVLDVRKDPKRGTYEVWTHNGTRATGRSPVDLAREMEQRGAGEIVINSIDMDGVMKGYDLPLISAVREAVTLPLTALGGAGSLKDIQSLVAQMGIIGAAAGSLFVFKGT
ncbi:MAG TPA: AglZ/HisF2 family acetamidino modification protein, partial [Steroidobacteraceae bacterium]